MRTTRKAFLAPLLLLLATSLPPSPSLASASPSAGADGTLDAATGTLDAATGTLDAATGTLEVFPYSSKRRSLRCTAFHVGGGLMATAGHCFLGARDCNGAQVVFNSAARRPFPRKHSCLEVEAVSADVMRHGSAGVDLALFRIAEPPSASLTPSDGSGLAPDAPLVSVEGLRGHRATNETGVTGCAGAWPWPTDFFGRPRPRALARSTCAHGGFAHGAPVLLPGTTQVVGVVAGVFRLPTPRSTFATAIATLARGEFDALPGAAVLPGDVVHVGSFSTEAFPNGLEDGLDAVMARIDEADDVELSVAAGIASEVRITDGGGVTTLFLGASSFSEAAPRKYRGPLVVRVRTAPGASGVSATLRRH